MHYLRIIVASAGIALSAPALAQQLPAETAAAAVAAEVDRDDGNPRLGLLGLLGLVGLLGLFRREPNIHIDMRRDRRT